MLKRVVLALILFIFTVGSLGCSQPSVVTIQAPMAVTVYVTNSGEKYHRDGCRYLSKSKVPIDRLEARATGYAPCAICKP
jgi:hypothetical protein